jgi:hypothetical protein
MTLASLKRYAILIISLTLVDQTALSQEDSAGTSTSFLMKNGTQALQFDLIGQVAASYKYHLSGQSALRLTADISGLFREDKEDYVGRDQSTDSRVTKVNSQQFKITPSYLFYFNAEKRVKLFVGVGPFVGFSRNRRDYSHVETNPDRSYSFQETTVIWQYGVSGHGGLECHITDYLSMLAEYEIAAGYAPTNLDNAGSDSNSPSPYSYSQRVRTWKIELSSLRVGVGVYL